MEKAATISKYIAGAVALIVIGLVVWYFSNIVIYIIAAAVLSILGRPAMEYIAGLHVGKVRIPRGVAAALTLVLLALLVCGFFYVFIPVIFDKLSQLASIDFEGLSNQILQPLQQVESFIVRYLPVGADFSITQAIGEQVGSYINLSHINDFVSSFIGTVTSFFIAIFSIGFITFFFLKDKNLFSDGVTLLFPARNKDNVTRALDSANRLLVRYFVGIVIESTVVLIIVAVGMLIVGFDLQDSLLYGLIMGVLNVIPYVGPFMGYVIGVLIGLLSPIPGAALLPLVIKMVAVFAIAQLVDNMVLQPLIYSNSVKAHPLEIFIVLLIAGSIGGIWGMLVAVPSYTVLRVFAKEFLNNFRIVRKLTDKI